MIDNLGGRLGASIASRRSCPTAQQSRFDRALGGGAFFERPQTALEEAREAA